MKKLIPLLLIIAFTASHAEAQLREDLSTPWDYSGQVIQPNSETVDSGLDRFFKSMRMSHTYSMNFSSYGGNYQNINAYTNTMQFSLTPKLDGRVDVSFLHSPFGGNHYLDNNSGIENQVILRNAELNYQINDNAHIRIQYQQLPGYGFGSRPYGYGYYDRFSPYSNFGYWY